MTGVAGKTTVAAPIQVIVQRHPSIQLFPPLNLNDALAANWSME